MKHYIYKTSSPSGKYYIGRHSTNNLDDGYLGSGKWIRQMKDTSNLVVEILEYAKDFEHLIQLEEKYLSEHINHPDNMNWNNRSVGFAVGNLNWNTTPEGRAFGRDRKLGKTYEELYGEKRAAEIKAKISQSQSKPRNAPSWNSGLDKRDPRIAAMAERISESVQTWMDTLSPEERKQKFGNYGEANGFYGKKHNDKTREIISAKAKARPKKTCRYCNKSVSPSNYVRWHDEKCKYKGKS